MRSDKLHRQIFLTVYTLLLLYLIFLRKAISADGGKVRLRRPQGEKSEWKDYKAIVSEAGMVASFNQNDIIINWANKQPLAKPITCLGDGHD
ncbi:hypothetical protein QUA90_30215, partial [Microcoleus sp. D3_18_C4]